MNNTFSKKNPAQWMTDYSQGIVEKVSNIHFSSKYKYPKFSCKDFDREIDILEHRDEMNGITHIQDYLEIIYTIKGCCHVRFNEKDIIIPQNSFILLGTELPHTDYSEPDSKIYQILIDYKTITSYILQNVNEAPRLGTFMTNFILNPKGLNYLLYKDMDELDPSITNGFNNILRAFAEKKEHYIPIIRGELVLLLLRISREYGKSAILSKKKSTPEQMAEYIYSNYNTVTLQSLADHFSYNKDHVSRLIKKEFGISFNKLVTKVRIEQSELLLGKTDMPVVKIAGTVGYSSVVGFQNTFKTNVGMTPNEYRMKINKEREALKESPGE